MSLSVFDIASSRLALGRSSFFVMGAKALFNMLTQVLEGAADVRQGTGGNLERPPTPSAKAFGERSETGAFGQKFRQLLRRKKHARGPSLDTDVHADRLCAACP